MTTYYIHKCRLCCATFASAITEGTPSPQSIHNCCAHASGQAELLGAIQTEHDLNDPTKLHAALERIKFGGQSVEQITTTDMKTGKVELRETQPNSPKTSTETR